MATVHIIGGGVSGLAAATQLAAAHIPVKLYEATAHAGGRARSSMDAELGTIDHGLHFIHGSARETLTYLERIGASDRVQKIAHPLPPTRAPIVDYLALADALLARDGHIETHDDNYLMDEWLPRIARLLLHTPLDKLSSRAARNALLRTRRTCLIAKHSLSETFISPALDHLDYHGGSVYFSHALSKLERNGERIGSLTFARKKIPLMEDDILILATPPAFTQSLLPNISVPTSTHASITIHYEIAHREATHSITAPIHAPIDLLRYEPNRISAMIRVADAQWHSEPELLAHRIWRWLQTYHPYLQSAAQPTHAIWREKRAGHRLTPHPQLDLSNLPPRVLIAGDWTVNHAPSSIETAILSGHHAATEAAKHMPKFTPRAAQHPVNHYNIQ